MDKLVKGLTLIAAGSVTWKAIKEVRRRKLQKEMYEAAEVQIDDNQA